MIYKLIILILLSCQAITVNTDNLQIYNGHRQDYLFIKFSSDQDFRHVESPAFGEPLEFYTCSESTLTIISDPKKDLGWLRPMLVIMNKDTIYQGWATKHQIEIDLIKGKWSNIGN